MDAQALIAAANERLKLAQYGVSIHLRGQKLCLRATLPPKPYSSRLRPYQQTISLGLPSNVLGIQQAETKAVRLGTELILGTFSWNQYASYSREPLSRLIKRFEQHHRSRHKMTDGTWERSYLFHYNKLPQNEPLSPKALMELVFEKQPHTRARQQLCRQWQKLCNFALIEIDLLQYQGTYNSSTSVARDVPTDEEIVEGYRKMRSPQWRWIYGMMATFGLRDHECWLCEFAGPDSLQVTGGKTGPRLIELPLYPEWVEAWRLTDVCRPDLHGDRVYIAAQCSQTFRRAKIGFPPYVLRYAYGHRGIITFNYQSWLMARQMGHSVDVNRRTYQRFMNARVLKAKVAEMKARPDQPRAPDA